MEIGKEKWIRRKWKREFFKQERRKGEWRVDSGNGEYEGSG